ncbi:MAG TPA: hypothetical protein VMF59_07990 [Bacteroidota bacterium]|nr:hypothetical protein [Bacteroidota bacterium]
MSVTMRIMQQFDPVHETEFMELEKKFAELEKRRKDFPNGKRLQPISAAEPCNTLIWQCEFPDIESANKTLAFFSGDKEHEKLLAKQILYFRQVKVEFYNNLEF